MPSLLILDDESHIVTGYKEGIDWSSIGIGPVYGADRPSEAKRICTNEEIDILLCDIEMPGQNGLAFAEWAKGSNPLLQVIFLTGHPDFDYARKAIRLDSFDYLLKPCPVGQLLDTVATAAEAFMHAQSIHLSAIRAERLETRWNTHRSQLIQHFWKDYVCGQLDLSSNELDDMLSDFQLLLTSDSLLRPCLVTHVPQDGATHGRLHGLVDATLLEALEEVFGKSGTERIIPVKAGAFLWLQQHDLSTSEIAVMDKGLIEILAKLSSDYGVIPVCYRGRETTVSRLPDCYGHLLTAWSDNVSPTRMIYDLAATKVENTLITAGPKMEPWTDLLESPSQNLLHERISRQLSYIDRHPSGSEPLSAFCHLFLGSVLFVLHRNGLRFADVIPMEKATGHHKDSLQWADVSHIKTIRQADSWAHALAKRTMSLLSTKGASSSTIVKKARQYIDNHLQRDLTRNAIASYVFVHPNYLSKLFRLETGMTMTDYILKMRIDKAKELLQTTEDKIGTISESVGFTNGGYFARLFYEQTGMSPLAYQKSHRQS